MFKKILIVSFLILILSSCLEDNKNITNNKETKENMNKAKTYTQQFFSQIPVSEFKKEMEDSDKILIDVRTPGEIPKYGKLRDNQILIDINDDSFISEIAKLDKTKEYLVYCWHGNRSQVARNYMQQEGFSYVKDLKGGIDEWVIEGESVLK